MAFTLFQGGIGGSSGDTLTTNTGPLLATKVIYLDSATGSDTYSGLQRDRPKATLAGANAIAVNGCIIVMLSTHSETSFAGETISANYVTLVGEGSSGGYPTASLTPNSAAQIVVSGVGVQMRNFKLAAATSGAANTDPRIRVTGTRFSALDLYLECGGREEDAAIELATGSTCATVKGCTFVSVATSATDLPTYGLLVSNAGNGLEIVSTVFDDGTYGFDQYACYGSGTVPNVRGENISLLRGAEMRMTGYGFLHVGTTTGGGRITEA